MEAFHEAKGLSGLLSFGTAMVDILHGQVEFIRMPLIDEPSPPR